MVLFNKKLKAEFDENGSIVATGREENNFVDSNGNRVYRFDLSASEDWINTNPTTFLDKQLSPGQIVICWDNWQAYIFNGTVWNAG